MIVYFSLIHLFSSLNQPSSSQLRVLIGLTSLFGGSFFKDLVKKLKGVNANKALSTILNYNQSVNTKVKFDPTIKDGKNTKGLKINKSNWANKIDKSPFYAFGVTCGITFTFGGLKINNKCEVLDNKEKPIKGLYAAGEMVGGIFYLNYPGGSGLMSGSVFGRIAGKYAAKLS